MSAGFPASISTGGNSGVFPNLSRSISSSTPSSTVAGLLQQQLNSTSGSLSGSGSYSTYPQPNSFLEHPYFAAAAAAAAAAANSSPGSSPFGFSDKQHRIKLKRTRQRVDAGEPRNTYNSFIPAYQKAPAPFGYPSPALRPPLTESSSKHSPTDTLFSGLNFPSNPNESYVQNLLRGMHIQQSANIFQDVNGEKSNDPIDDEWRSQNGGIEEKISNGNAEKNPASPEIDNSPISDTPTFKIDNGENGGNVENDKKLDSPNSSSGPSSNRSKRKQYQPQQLDVNTTKNSAVGERDEDEQAGADPLLLSMTTTDFDQSDDDDGKSLNGEEEELNSEKKKRKINHENEENVDKDMESDVNELGSGDEAGMDEGDDGTLDEVDQLPMHQIKRMQTELMFMQQRYIEALAASQQQQKQLNYQRPPDKESTKPTSNGGNVRQDQKASPTSKDMKAIYENMKSDLYTSICSIVDEWMERAQKCMQVDTVRLNNAMPMFGQPQMSMPQSGRLQQNLASKPSGQTPTPQQTTASTAPIISANVTANSMVSTPALGPPPPPAVSHGQETPIAPTNLSTTGPRPQFYFNPFYYNSFPYASAGLNFAAAAAAAAASGHQTHPPSAFVSSSTVPGGTPVSSGTSSTIFPTFPGTPVLGTPIGSALSNQLNQTPQSPYLGLNLSHKATSATINKCGLDDISSNSLPMPRKKRSKVTDTRVTKLNFRNDDLGQLHAAAAAAAAAAAHQLRGSPAAGGAGGFFGTGAYPPTLLPPHLLGSHHQSPFASGLTSALGANGGGRGSSNFDDSDPGAISPDNSDGTGSEMTPYDPNAPQSVTLSPMHLRKAKLMFFYTRYPSSALLKAYFPDIRFNKNNTAQLVKWFSNFREFYYIQMEKYARQALAEGVRTPGEIHISLDSELYKVLNLHYNRNNHIQVPPNFRAVVEATLKEFFVSIQAGRDAEPSWKKAIYKVIARLDDPIPEYFKTPNFLEQLE